MKTCTKCKIEKTEKCFYPNKRYKDGLSYWCKLCEAEYKKINPHKKPTKKVLKDRRLKYSYGLSVKQLTVHLEKINYKCQICEKILTINTVKVDHCHITEQVRGFLCDKCNRGLGNFGD